MRGTKLGGHKWFQPSALAKQVAAAAVLMACRGESVLEPFGLRLRVHQDSAGGSVAEWIRREGRGHPDCPSFPAVNAAWPARTLTRPAGRVSLPPLLESGPASASEVTFFARDLSAGAFVYEANGVAGVQVPSDSAMPPGSMTSCRLLAGSVESVVYLIARLHPVRARDSVYLAFLQVVLADDGAVLGGAFASTRALRDSMVRALFEFEPLPP